VVGALPTSISLKNWLSTVHILHTDPAWCRSSKVVSLQKQKARRGPSRGSEAGESFVRFFPPRGCRSLPPARSNSIKPNKLAERGRTAPLQPCTSLSAGVLAWSCPRPIARTVVSSPGDPETEVCCAIARG
jgi:hypothetical protein